MMVDVYKENLKSISSNCFEIGPLDTSNIAHKYICVFVRRAI